MLAEHGIPRTPAVATEACCTSFLSLRHDLVGIVETQKRLARLEQELSSLRDNAQLRVGTSQAPAVAGTPRYEPHCRRCDRVNSKAGQPQGR
eukprot:scaffold582_cov385-Prasinococcus_capsulatus_cf.AAC.22